MKALAGKVAVVTGGATGIGAGITERLAKDGWHVFVVQRTPAEAERGSRLMHSYDFATEVVISAYDLAQSSQCRAAVLECIRHFGRIDVLVNNAALSGAAAYSPLEDTSDDLIDRVIDTNLKAPIRLAREALPYLAASKGVIVNISSIAELQAQSCTPTYVASKAGLGGFTRALAYDLAPRGIRAVCIAPGDIETPASRNRDLMAKRSNVKKTPLEFAGQPEDVANVVCWVISPEARFITGNTIAVDGGRTAY